MDRGGKIIVYHGWADDMVPSQVSTDYHASVTAKMGPAHVKSSYRLLMVPGMAHCGAGPGAIVLFDSEEAAAVPLEPDRDMLTALERWWNKVALHPGWLRHDWIKAVTSNARVWSAHIRISRNIAALEMSTGRRIGNVQQNDCY